MPELPTIYSILKLFYKSNKIRLGPIFISLKDIFENNREWKRMPMTQLKHLANLYGINTSYRDMSNRIRPASQTALLSMLKALGAPVESVRDVSTAIRDKILQNWQQPIEPVLAVRQNDMLKVNLHLPVILLDVPLAATFILENGVKKGIIWRASEDSILESKEIEGNKYVFTQFYVPERLPTGYHRLILETPGKTTESMIISAPSKAFQPQNKNTKIWGVFLPLYALRTNQNWGAGDYSDLEKLIRWVSRKNGRIVGSLPLLPSFFNNEFGFSPYTPASRLFWNEFYINIDHIPEIKQCPRALALLTSNEVQEEISALRRTRQVEYTRLLSLKRTILEELCACFFSEKPLRYADFQHYVKSNQIVLDYARFRAAGESHGICWHQWPAAMRNGRLSRGDFSRKNERYYLYTQWLAQEQINNLSREAEKNKTCLYMDLPVGVHPFSYDVWSERSSFVLGVNGGAPPDPVFTSGQNWNFPPLHPNKIRQQGYRYLIRSLRHQLQAAGMLRIDHMMNFHRLFCIPEGVDTSEGVYLSYRADEMYAILSLESHRHNSIIIGEDLGMVPPEVRPMMDKYGIYRMFVGQYQLIAENQLGDIPANSVASLNTHDMFPFASFWDETDIKERQKLKLINEEVYRKEIKQRRQIKKTLLSILKCISPESEISQDTLFTMESIYRLLAASPAYALLINLEDLWLETQPQNVPGTQNKQNWSQKARYTLEQFSRSPAILSIIKNIDRNRKGVSIQ